WVDQKRAAAEGANRLSLQRNRRRFVARVLLPAKPIHSESTLGRELDVPTLEQRYRTRLVEHRGGGKVRILCAPRRPRACLAVWACQISRRKSAREIPPERLHNPRCCYKADCLPSSSEGTSISVQLKIWPAHEMPAAESPGNQ